MTKTEELVEFVGKTVFRGTLIIFCSYVGATLARAEASNETILKPHVRNLVVEPDYTDTEESDTGENSDEPKTNPEKLQFEPVIDDKPILEERKLLRDIKPGVEYPEGVEMVVTPEPGFSVKEEVIEEKPEAVASPEPIEAITAQ